jgi:hypothetical protein
MKLVLAFSLALFAPFAALAEEVAASEPETLTDATPERGTPALPYIGTEVTLEEFAWAARPLVVFADSPNDPAFQRQMRLLAARPDALAERDVVVIVDTDPAAQSNVRLALRPRGFALVILGKEGEVIQRKPSPWDVREIGRAIDRTPLREQELREERSGGG